VCGEAEAAGADALWAVDHLFWPRPMHECFTTLAVAAAATTQVVLGSCVLQVPLRRPAVVAKQAAALQALSAGRFVLGVGVGSHRGEYEAAGVPFSRRGRLLDEGLAELRACWAREAGDYPLAPSPGSIPVWVGGSSRAALARAARGAEGWVPMFLAPEAYATSLATLRDLAGREGRPPDAVRPAVVVMVSVGAEPAARDRGTEWLSTLFGVPPAAFARHLVAGPADACAERLAAYRDSGAEHIVVMMADDRPLEGFAELRRALRVPDAGSGATPAGGMAPAPAGSGRRLVEVRT